MRPGFPIALLLFAISCGWRSPTQPIADRPLAGSTAAAASFQLEPETVVVARGTTTAVRLIASQPYPLGIGASSLAPAVARVSGGIPAGGSTGTIVIEGRGVGTTGIALTIYNMGHAPGGWVFPAAVVVTDEGVRHHAAAR